MNDINMIWEEGRGSYIIMHRRLLAVFAHPDDEAFGPGGTLAKYAAEGIEIHLLCATRGEAGEWHEKKLKVREEIQIKETVKLHHVRERELLESAKVLGIQKVEFLDFIDGTLCNAVYHRLAERIKKKINTFQPQVVLTLDRFGISGHLDHIAVSLTTTFAFLKTQTAQKLYYACLPKEFRDKTLDNYFIYFPEGYDQKDITTRIDWTHFWKQKVAAMHKHKTQMKDVKRILSRIVHQPHIDHFILQESRNLKAHIPETDLFAGIFND